MEVLFSCRLMIWISESQSVSIMDTPERSSLTYYVTKDLKSEVKLGSNIFLKDLLAIIMYPAIMWYTTSMLVAGPLKVVYLFFNIAVALYLIQRPSSNPGKQIWQIYLLLFNEDERTYHMMFPSSQEKAEKE